MDFEQLPVELVVYIIKFLDNHELFYLKDVSTYLKVLVHNECQFRRVPQTTGAYDAISGMKEQVPAVPVTTASVPHGSVSQETVRQESGQHGTVRQDTDTHVVVPQAYGAHGPAHDASSVSQEPIPNDIILIKNDNTMITRNPDGSLKHWIAKQ